MIRLLPVKWFGKASMERINVLSIERISAEDRMKIEAVDPAIQLTDAGGWFDGEMSSIGNGAIRLIQHLQGAPKA